MAMRALNGPAGIRVICDRTHAYFLPLPCPQAQTPVFPIFHYNFLGFHRSHNMDRHYSTLELVKHDNTASAPERDHDAAASELDASRSAPEVCSRNNCQ